MTGLVGLARWGRAVICQTIGFSLAVKAVAAVRGLAGLVTLWMAVLADIGPRSWSWPTSDRVAG